MLSPAEPGLKSVWDAMREAETLAKFVKAAEKAVVDAKVLFFPSFLSFLRRCFFHFSCTRGLFWSFKIGAAAAIPSDPSVSAHLFATAGRCRCLR